MQNVLKFCKTFSKLNCVSLTRKNGNHRVIPRGTKIVDCRYNLKSSNIPLFFQLTQMRKLELSLFQAVDRSILMIISIIIKLLNLNLCTTVNPIRPWGGGGLKGPDDQTQSCQSETSYSMMPKLSDF